MTYYIGIDGGGTKTKFTLFDDKFEALDSYVSTTSHVGQVKKEGLKDVLLEGIKYFNLDEKPIICAGLAGYGVVKAFVDQIDEVFKEEFSEYTYHIVSDIKAAYFGAIGDNKGAVIIAGTGSIGYALNENKFERVGGYGFAFSDEGSAYYIGRLLIQEFFKQSDNRKEKTRLYYYLKEIYNIEDDYDLIRILNNERVNIAKASLYAYHLAKENELNALSILNDAAIELAEIANTLVKTDETINVSFIGGVANSFDIMMPMIKKASKTNINYQKPLYNAEYGAILAYLTKDKYEN